MMIRLGLLFSLLLASVNVQARDFEGGYAVYGAGARPCSNYTRAMERGGPEQDFFIDWVIGYLSAFNVIMPNTYDILGEVEFTTSQLWLEEHCQKYPRELFVNAVAKMTEVLYPTRYQSGLKESPATAPSTPDSARPGLNDLKIQ